MPADRQPIPPTSDTAVIGERRSNLLSIVLLRDASFWRRSRGRRLGRLLLAAVYLYVALLGVLLALENRLAFPGSLAFAWQDRQPGPEVVDVELTTADGNRIHAWFATPPGWRPERGAVLYSHGNGGNLSWRTGGVVRWRDATGRAILIYDYPGYGKSTGSPNEASCYAAAEAAYAWLLDEAKVPPKEIILLGSSMGGAMATELATRHRCRMLVLVNSFTSFPDMAQQRFPWLPARWLVRNQFDNLGKLPEVGCPVFITHGEADQVVPYAQGRRLFDAAHEPKRFLSLPDHPHSHPRTPAFFAAVNAFLKETAK